MATRTVKGDQPKLLKDKTIRDMARSKGMMVGSDFIPELETRVRLMVFTAFRRTEENGRKKVRGFDV